MQKNKNRAAPVRVGAPKPTFSGPVAVLRNLKAVYTGGGDQAKKRVVVIDREYTSVALMLRLKRLGYYGIGTVTLRRLGFPKQIKYKAKKTPASIPRGFSRVAALKKEDDVKATVWFDSAPVYFLSTGVGCDSTTLERKAKDGSNRSLPCPRLVDYYNKYMGGVDAHDQLRLQRYSLQMALRAKKYYKTLFFGLLDIAMINALIIHKEFCKSVQQKPLSHADFKILLHQELLQIADDELAVGAPTNDPSVVNLRSSHRMVKTTELTKQGYLLGKTCKVCSIKATKEPGKRVHPSESKWYVDLSENFGLPSTYPELTHFIGTVPTAVMVSAGFTCAYKVEGTMSKTL